MQITQQRFTKKHCVEDLFQRNALIVTLPMTTTGERQLHEQQSNFTSSVIPERQTRGFMKCRLQREDTIGK